MLDPATFYEGCLNGTWRIATTRAMAKCTITRLEKAAMIAAIHKEPTFELFMAYLLSRTAELKRT